MIYRYEVLSKKCNNLSKQNIALQLECDRLIKEIQVLKRTTMRKHANILYLEFFFKKPSTLNVLRNYLIIY